MSSVCRGHANLHWGICGPRVPDPLRGPGYRTGLRNQHGTMFRAGPGQRRPPTWQQVVGRTTPGPVCPDPHPIRHTLCGRGRASPAMIRSRSWSAHAGPRLFGPAADPSHAFQAGPHWMRCARPGRPDGAIGARERETPRAAISVGPMRNPLRYPGSRSGAVVLCPIECEIRDARQLLCN